MASPLLDAEWEQSYVPPKPMGWAYAAVKEFEQQQSGLAAPMAPQPRRRKSGISPVVPLSIVAIVGAVGYYWYSKRK